jgi:cytochrome P450
VLRTFFSPQRIEEWEQRCIRPLVHRLIDRFEAKGQADLLKDFTSRLPVHVIAHIIGYPARDVPAIQRWALELLSVTRDLGTGMAGSEALSQYLRGLLAERRAHPRDDLLSYLVQAELEGRPLEEHEILSFLLFLTPSGFETTFRALTNLLFGLLTQPEQLQALRANPSLLPQAVEEGLRWEANDIRMMRVCVRDSEVCGVFIPAGAIVHASLASANRDEAVFENAASFDIFRPQRPHLTFSAGAHFCLGARLSRLELSASVEGLLERLPNLRLDPRWDDPYVHGCIFRGPRQLPVLF